MKNEKVNIKQVKFSAILHAKYHMNIAPVLKRYQNLLNKRLKDCVKKPFHKITKKISDNELIKGDIILRNNPNGKIVISTYQGNNQKIPSGLKFRITHKSISPEYLIWHFSHQEVKDFLNIHSTGSVIRQIPREILYNLEIPIPKIIGVKQKKNKTTISTESSPVREIIRNFYNDFLENYNSNRLDTAIILAGAICEALLYESLIDEGVPDKILSQNKTFGTLIEYAQIKELDKVYNISLTHFENIKQYRNKTIHIGSSIKRWENGEFIDKEIFKDFDNIIKNFGI